MGMNCFIYVFTREARDVLLARGYQLLKSDERNSRYVFVNRLGETFSCEGISYILGDTLTF